MEKKLNNRQEGSFSSSFSSFSFSFSTFSFQAVKMILQFIMDHCLLQVYQIINTNSLIHYFSKPNFLNPLSYPE